MGVVLQWEAEQHQLVVRFVEEFGPRVVDGKVTNDAKGPGAAGPYRRRGVNTFRLMIVIVAKNGKRAGCPALERSTSRVLVVLLLGRLESPPACHYNLMKKQATEKVMNGEGSAYV